MKNRKYKSSHLLLLFLICLLMITVSGKLLDLAEANFFPISIPQPAFVIRSDGNVDPSTAPISREGNVYTFTDDIVGYTIAVERDNIVLDGNGYTLKGNGSSTGIFIKNRNDIVVKNMKISGFNYGIWLFAEDLFSILRSRQNDILMQVCRRAHIDDIHIFAFYDFVPVIFNCFPTPCVGKIICPLQILPAGDLQYRLNAKLKELTG